MTREEIFNFRRDELAARVAGWVTGAQGKMMNNRFQGTLHRAPYMEEYVRGWKAREEAEVRIKETCHLAKEKK